MKCQVLQKEVRKMRLLEGISRTHTYVPGSLSIPEGTQNYTGAGQRDKGVSGPLLRPWFNW